MPDTHLTRPGAEPDLGTGYDRPAPSYDRALTEVGRGTPMGELLRRYWHPVGLSSDAGGVPRRVKALGEDLILFRDGTGRPGLVEARCAHRGSSLYYGKVEERGIRCCYHGWLFDAQGHCLEQPCEPEGGRKREAARQPWYPVQEAYGLIFAYMGPPAKKPVLPRYDILEELEPGETVEADDSSIGGGGPAIIPCNWLQHWENVVDPWHVPVLHGSFSGTQFTKLMEVTPQVRFEYGTLGVDVHSERRLEDGRVFRRLSGVYLPTLRVVPNPRVAEFSRCESIGWVLPMDDTTFRIYVAGRVREPGGLSRIRSTRNGKYWEDLTEAERRDFPGDYEAQVSQGPITWHSDEHLATTDQGIVMARRMLRQGIAAIGRGEDPIGVTFDPGQALVRVPAGNFITNA